MRVAAVDIGTNSTRLLIVETDGSELIDVKRLATVTALGRGVDRSRRLAADAIERTVTALAGYATSIESAGVTSARAVATSASRDATNKETFFDAAQSALGFRPEAISGAEEARLSFVGATNGVDHAKGAVVIDTGGGSTEFVGMRRGVSVDIGSVRLTERCLPNHPASFVELDAARTEAARAVASREVPTGTHAIGVAGTWTSLAAMHQNLEAYDSVRINGSMLRLDDVRHLVNWLRTRSLAEKQAIPSLDPKRAPVILGGAVVAEASLQALALDRITVSEHDILDGVCLGLLGVRSPEL